MSACANTAEPALRVIVRCMKLQVAVVLNVVLVAGSRFEKGGRNTIRLQKPCRAEHCAQLRPLLKSLLINLFFTAMSYLPLFL